MISRLRGILREQQDLHVLLDVQGICYEILIPPSILQGIQERLGPNNELELVTFHYQQLDMGRGIPVLIGFLNDIEREFFSRFITVAGVGPKAALRALTQPIPLIAQAIDEGNLSLLKSLPGIGPQRAREIIAKLQGKVGKFALIQTKEQAVPPVPHEKERSALEEEATAVLLQLEYKRSEAREMVQAAFRRNPAVKTAEELLNEVYRQSRLTAEPV